MRAACSGGGAVALRTYGRLQICLMPSTLHLRGAMNASYFLSAPAHARHSHLLRGSGRLSLSKPVAVLESH